MCQISQNLLWKNSRLGNVFRIMTRNSHFIAFNEIFMTLYKIFLQRSALRAFSLCLKSLKRAASANPHSAVKQPYLLQAYRYKSHHHLNVSSFHAPNETGSNLLRFNYVFLSRVCFKLLFFEFSLYSQVLKCLLIYKKAILDALTHIIYGSLGFSYNLMR